MLVKPVRARAIALYRDAFGAAPRVAASAPGRVSLLGEHTAYNGGPVLLVAAGERAVVAVGPGEPETLEVVSEPGGERERHPLGDARPGSRAAYLAGVLRELRALGAAPAGGVRVAVASDVPTGLGPSAAFAVALARALSLLAGADITGRRLAGVAFRAERDHAGIPSGVMDHTTVALARRDQALLVEAASADWRRVPLGGVLFVVELGPEGARRDAVALLERRRVECEAALVRLRVELPELFWLASWPTPWIARLKKALPEPLRSRALHVIGETARARFGAELLARGRRKQFGDLLYESHESSRRLYECSAPALDLVVATAKRAGALGARLTGLAGNAVVVLLRNQAGGSAVRIASAIRRALARPPGIEAVITAVRPGGGVRREAVRLGSARRSSR